MARTFTHLHVHTEYSTLDGAARPADLAAACRAMGMTHLAITDHGNLYGADAFRRQAEAAGVTPIIGMEAYLAPGSRRDRDRTTWGRPEQRADDVSGSGAYTHATLWAVEETGLRNLFRLSYDAYREGWSAGRPRTDREELARHAAGLVASTGCPSGEVQTRLRLGQYEEALRAAADHRDIFGRDNYFLELMDHGAAVERRVRDGLLEIGRRLGIPPLVTNDAHHTAAAEADVRQVLLAFRTGRTLADPGLLRFDGTGYHLRSAEEMYALDGSEAWQRGCANTALIAERVAAPLPWPAGTAGGPGGAAVTAGPPPGSGAEDRLLRERVARGLARRHPDGVPAGRLRRADAEAAAVARAGLAVPYLVLADLVDWAGRHGIEVGPGGDGAAAGLVGYALGLTGLDPAGRYPGGLRAAHQADRGRGGGGADPAEAARPGVGHSAVPGIAVDERHRAELVAYLARRHGADRVALAAAHHVIGARAAVRGAARVLGRRYPFGERIADALPEDQPPGRSPLAAVLDPEHPRYGEAAGLRAMYRRDPAVRQVVDAARAIEGRLQRVGAHPSGVIVSGAPLADLIPLWVRRSDGSVVTGWERPERAVPGLLRVDLAPSPALAVLRDTVTLLRSAAPAGSSTGGADPAAPPREDAATFRLLRSGHTLGVPGLDDEAARRRLRDAAPATFAQWCALAADLGVDPLLGYRAGYLKARHPAAYLAALLGSAREDAPRVGVLLDECRRIGLTVLPPDVNESEDGFTPRGERVILFGLGAVRGVGPEAVAAILRRRREHGRFASFPDFVASVEPAARTERVVTALIEAGAFDQVNHTRRALAEHAPALLDRAARADRAAAEGQFGLFDAVAGGRPASAGIPPGGGEAERGAEPPGAEREVRPDRGWPERPDREQPAREWPDGQWSDREWDEERLLARERRALGGYVSGHPLHGAEQALRDQADAPLDALGGEAYPDGTVVTVGGVLTEVRRRGTRWGEEWAAATVADLTGRVECVFRPAVYRSAADGLAEDRVVLVTGRVESRAAAPRLIASGLAGPDLSAAPGPGAPVTLDIRRDRLTAPLVRGLARVLAEHRGSTEVRVRVRGESGGTLLRLDRRHRVAPAPGLFEDLRRLLGPGPPDPVRRGA